MVANGYHVKRSGDIQLIMRSGWNEEYDVRYPGKGTNHGSWAPYDTHIPLIFMVRASSRVSITAVII